MGGDEFVDSISFEPYTPSTGSLLVVAIEVEQTSGYVAFNRPEFVGSIEDANAFAGWGVSDLVNEDGRTLQVFYGPVQDYEDYTTFPCANPGVVSDDAVIRARLYEFESDLGRILGYFAIEDETASVDIPVETTGDFWFAAPTGYNKQGVSIGLSFRSSGQDEADFTESLGVMHKRPGPFGSYSQLGYGQTSMASNETLTLPSDGEGSMYERGVWILRAVVPQSKYQTVQEESVVGSSTITFDQPDEGNLLIANVRSFASVSFGSEWNVEEVVRSDDALFLTVAWRAATAGDITSLNIAGATDIEFIEVAGFDRPPTLLKSVRLDSSITEDDPGYNPALHGGYTSMPFSVPGNDAIFFASEAYDTPTEYSFLLPEFEVRGGTHNMRSEADGWDFYPDGGMPVMILGFTSVPQPEGIVGFGALFIETPVPPEPPAPINTIALGCPKSVRACALRITKLNGSGVPLDPLTGRSRVQTAAFAELSLNPDMERGQETVIKANGGEAVAIIDRGCDILKGLELTLKLCGVPFPVLELLIGNEIIEDDDGNVIGGTLPEQQGSDCVSPVMIELWSKNLGEGGGWIHWLVPKSFKWSISGSLSFSNGPLDIELTGYAQGNPAWYPSLPNPDLGFKAYVPGNGAVPGWPTGGAGEVVLPDDVSPDPWRVGDLEKIRRAGPLAWRVVSELPEPLSDCDFLPASCSAEFTFCGPEGEELSFPWVLPYLGGLTVG